MSADYPIPYPRLAGRRRVIRVLGRVLLRLLSQPVVTGLENLPERGPYLLVGNHVELLEPP